MFCLVLFALCASAVALPIDSAEVTINANVYVTNSVGIDLTNVTTITAGQTFVLNLLLTDQATNATIGSVMGFGVVLRSQGPFQLQYTVQLASGSLQVAGLNYLPGQPSPNQFTPALLAITGGTGLYTGASGYYQQIPYVVSDADTPGQAINGVIIKATF